MTEEKQRQSVVDEVLTWQKTPYHPEARLKGAGVDCGMLILQTFENVGLIPHVEIPHYSIDIACHSDNPMYLNKIKEYAHEVTGREPLPGDVFVYKFPDAKVPHHAAIYIGDGVMVHSYLRRGVEQSNCRGYKKYLVGCYSFW